MATGRWFAATRLTIYDMDRNEVRRDRQQSLGTSFMVDKGNHRHFMEKEIHEQPEVISHTLAHYVDFVAGTTRALDLPFDFKTLDRLAISACGTAYLSGLVGKVLVRAAGPPAGRHRYRLGIPLSRNADRRRTARRCSSRSPARPPTRWPRCAIAARQAFRSAPSSMCAARRSRAKSDVTLPTLAGPEIGVASTKAFTCQLSVLASLAVRAGVERGMISPDAGKGAGAPARRGAALRQPGARSSEQQIEKVARELSHYRHVLYLGRDTNYPLALEGALKLKEISYIHAEGYAAGELKHGPIALIDENMPVIVIAPHDRIFEKTVSNMQEVAARGGKIILITDREGCRSSRRSRPWKRSCCRTCRRSSRRSSMRCRSRCSPITPPSFMGTDVDQPRNLAKSVTVE